MTTDKNLLYNPENEHDACGVGLIVNIRGVKHHDVVENALQVLENMAHRGAEGADSKTGDGAGIMVQIPHEFILLNGIPVPERGRYGVAMVFMPKDPNQQRIYRDILRSSIEAEGLRIINRRVVPVDSSVLGLEALSHEPHIEQIFITGDDDLAAEAESYEKILQSKMYVAAKKSERKVTMNKHLTRKEDSYIVSMSTRTLVYKGMLTSAQLRGYFKDLTNPYFTSAVAMVHSRFSTNTFPSWRLAQPFRILAHNGEINTIKGNRLWMQTRQSVLHPENLGPVSEFEPIVQPDMSDSASLDNTVEFFVRSGMDVAHTLAMLIPESVDNSNPDAAALSEFNSYNSIAMEAWDGPAAILFSDGRYAGGLLDRNGLRPCKYTITESGMLLMASETGVLDIRHDNIAEKGRLGPGQMIMVDLEQGKILRNQEIKLHLAKAHPYQKWMQENRVKLSEIQSGRRLSHDVDNFQQLLRVFGFSTEDIDNIIKPMATQKAEPSYAMGNDTPLPILADKPHRLFDFFRQQFAQVTNPPIDSLRESSVMSLKSFIGAVKGNILHPSEEFCKVVELATPIISNSELDKLKNLTYKGFRTITLDMAFPLHGSLEKAIERLCQQALDAVNEGYNYIILSDKCVSEKMVPIPSLIAVSAIHHHLIQCQRRSQTALIVESGEVVETMHVALLVGYGASGVNPYMVFAILNDLVKKGELQLDYVSARNYYIEAVNKGLLKIISKMGISTIQSYRGAKLFECIGLSTKLLDRYFGGGMSQIEGLGIEDVQKQAVARHNEGFSTEEEKKLASHGRYLSRTGGERHTWSPKAISLLRKASQQNDFDAYMEFTELFNQKPFFLRDLVEVESDREPISLEEVEPDENIIHRFVAGAISFGAISPEAHEDIAEAMNSLGCQSNTGEGGEPVERFTQTRNGVSLSSKVKQVASGRFGVTTEYLVNAEEIQIKVAQGAKPGEGGQLPGFKVNELIAKTRHSIPGITLISPPPHHDIYSIEDLSQLIYDLKNVNPKARISVKLVSESGVGTIAAGVAKAKADVIVVSGAEGGTGASPLSSVFNAGMPMETGLAEVQQTLMLNRLRGKVSLQVDGQLKTGRDVIISALLGAEEYAFSTALMVTLGCIMDRKCHTNTCCVGIASQCEANRLKYRGKAEYIVNYLRFIARDIRNQLAKMGYRSLSDIIGRNDLLKQHKFNSNADKVNLSRLLGRIKGEGIATQWQGRLQDEPVNTVDKMLIEATAYSVNSKMPISLELPIRNTDRSVCAMLSGHIVREIGGNTLPEGTINLNFKGSAGQSFGAFLCNGINLSLEGDANDYLGKGISGGRIVVTPPSDCTYRPEDNVIAGNTLLYGATGGEVFINGKVGERFCVRNSGALAVVEGVGDHCCEYMTGGRTVVLGPAGRNFAAGMSGGIAYVWNPKHNFDLYCNMGLIELTLVETEEEKAELKDYIQRHLHHTGSPHAKELLDNWEQSVTEFIKVTPIEYKKILSSVNDVAE